MAWNWGSKKPEQPMTGPFRPGGITLSDDELDQAMNEAAQPKVPPAVNAAPAPVARPVSFQHRDSYLDVLDKLNDKRIELINDIDDKRTQLGDVEIAIRGVVAAIDAINDAHNAQKAAPQQREEPEPIMPGTTRAQLAQHESRRRPAAPAPEGTGEAPE